MNPGAAHEKEFCKSSVPFPTVLQNIDGSDISVGDIVNIAPAEAQLLVSFTSEPNWEALAFPEEYSTGKGHFNDNDEIPITPSKYVHACLKSSDDWASNPQYTFHALDWIQKNAVASLIYFSQRKHQADLNAGQVSSNNLRRTISDDQIYASFKNIKGTPQYGHNMKLDIVAKLQHFGIITFFGTLTRKFHWPEIIQIVACQYGTNKC